MKKIKNKWINSEFMVTKKNKVKTFTYGETVGIIILSEIKPFCIYTPAIFQPKALKETGACFGFDSTDLRAIADYMDSITDHENN